LKISFATVARIWRKWDLQPWRTATFKFSTDPELDAKIRPVVVLYMHRREKAVVLSIDEESVRPEALMRPGGMRGPPPVIAVTGRSWRQTIRLRQPQSQSQRASIVRVRAHV
jgi:hypothetical protein